MGLRESGGRRRERWEGGYIHRQKNGKRLFVIERQIGQDRFHVSTRQHTERDAYREFERFKADPVAYVNDMKHGRRDRDALCLTTELYLEFRDWLLSRDRPTTTKYANEMAHRLREWTEDLSGRDLRRLDLAHIDTVLERRATCRQHRIIALKSLMAWLRKKKYLIKREHDVTLDLTVPQAVPEKHKRRKAVPVEDFRAALRALAPVYRDCLYLLGRTGWHVTELERFARAPQSRIAPGAGNVLAVLQVLHKTGKTTRTSITDPEALSAAKRIRERGELPRRMNATLKRACAAAGVTPFTFGVCRHSFATWAIEAGNDPARVADFIDHADKSTTLAFYADVAVPKPILALPDL